MDFETVQASPYVQMADITMRFHNVVANDNVSINVYPGEVLGLLGENGAGKTTLMNVLYGLYQPEVGKILINNVETRIHSPKDAIDRGIGMVHQHFMLVRAFTVTENLALGLRDTSSMMLDLDTVNTKVLELSESYDIPVDPHAKIWQLSVGEQQRVEILNALLREAQILIFDEPTAVLTPQETKGLFNTFRLLTQQGKSVVFITHKLEEALAVTDRITILRRGRLIDTIPTAGTNKREIATMMVGREVIFSVDRKQQDRGDMLLAAEDLWVVGDKGLPALKGANLELYAGEILGIAGVDGNGQGELCEALSGLRSMEKGKVTIKGIPYARLDSRKVIDAGVAYIPEDRQHTGLVLRFPLWRNLVLKRYAESQFCQRLFLRFKNILAFARELIKRYDIRAPNEFSIVNTMSGGNQQKIILARELSSDPDILIANQPTRGIDIASIEYVHSQLMLQREEGKAILLVSRELNEVISLSDRIMVIYKGQFIGEVSAEDVDIEQIGALMLGIKGGNENE